MKLTFLSLILCSFAGTGFSQDTTTAKLDQLVQSYYNLGKFNGSVLVAKRGKILLEKGYGYKNFRDSTLNDPNTIYQIASVTKQFTAAVVLKLVELKKISLTDKLSRFYPGLPKSDSITIENLLTHTSGISDHFNDSTSSPADAGNEEKLLTSLKKYPLDFSPGADWQYSNKGYQLLGYIIQKVSGMSYYDAIKKYIFTPLHMNNSGFDFIHLVSGEKATGYWEYPRSPGVGGATIIDSSGPFAAGAIYSTVGDLYKWHHALQTFRVIRKSSLDRAYKPFKRNYGYGWMIDSLFGKRIIHHGGDIWGFRSDIARNVEEDICVIILNNVEDADLGLISMKLLSILCNQTYRLPAKNEILLAENILKSYTGSYEMQPGMLIEITLEGNRLMATTDHKEEIYAQKEDLFRIDAGDKQVDIWFEKNADGSISDLSFYKEGRKIICKKIK